MYRPKVGHQTSNKEHIMISVVIPVFNGEKYLSQTLNSIDFVDQEIIVVDDGSTDASAAIATQFGATVISVPHGGPVRARNTGIAAASGDYILMLDADDLMEPNAISQMFNKIGINDIIIARRQDFISPDTTQQFQINTSNHGVLAGCALIKRSAFDTVGLLDETLVCGDAYDWLLRAKNAGLQIIETPLITCKRRLHDHNMGMTMREQEQRDYCKIIRKHFIKK